MKRKLAKKVIGIALAACLAFSLIGCGGNETTGGETGTEGDRTAADGEMPVVKMAMPYIVELTDLEAVQDALNEVITAETGAKVEIVPIEYANYPNQLNLVLSSGEDSIDIFHTMFSFNIASLADNGQVLALDGLLDEYGQGIKEAVGEKYLNCGKVGDSIYAVPICDAYSSGLGYILRKDIADELGIVPEEVTDLDKLTEVLLKVKKAHPELDAIPTSSTGWYVDNTIDSLGDINYLGALMDYGQSTTVENYYATDWYKKLCEYGKQWQEAGLFTEDPLNNSNGSMAGVTNGTAAGCFSGRWSAEANVMDYQSTMGREIVAFQLSDPVATTSGVMNGNWCVTASCKNPEAAVKVLNCLFSNPEAADIVMNGLENVTYQDTGEGNITFAEGKDMMSAGWGTQMGFLWPNKTIAKPFAPQTEEYIEHLMASNDTCIVSKALGFTFDSTNVTDEITACTNVVGQYHWSLMAGIVDYEEVLPQFLSALEDAGIQKIVDEKQKQLDEWLAAQ